MAGTSVQHRRAPEIRHRRTHASTDRTVQTCPTCLRLATSATKDNLNARLPHDLLTNSGVTAIPKRSRKLVSQPRSSCAVLERYVLTSAHLTFRRGATTRSRVELTTAQIRCGWGADETIRSQRAFAARTVDCAGVCSPHLRAYRRERGRHQDLLEPIHFRQPADDGNGGTGLQLHADRIGAAPPYHPFLHHEQARMGRFQHHHRPAERDSHSE